MSDDTNIDDILRSIDALLKESEAGDAYDAKPGRSRYAATNDDEPVALKQDVPGGSSVADEYGPGITDEPEVADPGERPSVRREPVRKDKPALAESNMEAGSVPMEVSRPERVVKRIVLSEAMLVEHTPDLLAFAEQNAAHEKVPDEPVDRASPVSGAVRQDDSPERVPTVAVEQSLDTELLIKQVSHEISARLQDMLPALVAELVRKHIAAQQSANTIQNKTENDTQAD